MSYSSASMTKKGLSVSRADMPKFCGMPPTRKPGRMRASSRIHASIAEVVVLPWVPATANTHLSRSTLSASHCGPEV